MEELGILSGLKKKSLAAIRAVFLRQLLVKAIFFAGNIVLARILAPEIFGIYAIVSFIVQFFSSFGDIGIGAALIQKKGELTQEELSSTFWLQQLLVLGVVSVAIAAAPLALDIYPTLPPVGVWLIRAMVFSFLLSSLKTIPAILMERNIDFNRIAMVDIAENVTFQCVAITCALLGFGAWSFVAAALARAFVGAMLIYILSPWRPELQCRFVAVKGLVSFGLPYQANYILNFVKDAVTPLFVGAYVGATAVGYVNWARNLAFAPMFISEAFGRVAFPAFSKLQSDKALLGRTIERSIRMITLVMFPIAAVLIALAPGITHVIFTDKWMPGLSVFYCYCVSLVGIGVFLPLNMGVLALGKSKTLLILSVFLVFSEWGLGVIFVSKYGFPGIAYSQFVLVPFCTYIYWVTLKKHQVIVKIFSNILIQLTVSFIVCAALLVFEEHFVVDMFELFYLSVGGVLAYFVALTFVSRALIYELFDYSSIALKK